jgi:ABC-2 type transport system ATP-binding protein
MRIPAPHDGADRDGLDASAALAVRALTRRFGQVQAVDDLSFTVPTGTLFALLGPNGAGKSTTVEICEGFTRADSGAVRVLGLHPWRDQAALRPRIGVMLQAGGAHGSARTGEMLALLARCAARPHDPGELLDMVGLTGAVRTPVRRLSGGQVQRLSLAMALVGRPELLFLDEPTAGMDPQARHLVWDLLRAARADGVTIVLTTHLMDEAELLADQVLIIDHGRAVAAGTPTELTGAGTRVRFVTAPGLDLDPLRAALPPGAEVGETAPGRYLVTGNIPPTVAATVTTFCADAGAPAQSLEVGRRSLDEVFLELTGREVRS